MNQQEFDFNSDYNNRIYSTEENKIFDSMAIEYIDKRLIVKDSTILHQIFFEENCIELLKRLKHKSFFDGEWDLIENSFSFHFHDFIISKNIFYESSLSEFIRLIIEKTDTFITLNEWQNNARNEFIFDRKITEAIVENIETGNLSNAILLYISYLKIWNYFKIYTIPFNNNKAFLIHKILAEAIWPNRCFTYQCYNDFEKEVKVIINSINIDKFYTPFFDTILNDNYSERYIQQRNCLIENIILLFDFENTDESESYKTLLSNLLSSQDEDVKAKQIELIDIKLKNSNIPQKNDLDFIIELYNNSKYKEIAKSILKKFYLYNCLQI